MTLEATSLVCPNCGSEHVVEEGADRFLCLYCNTVATPSGSILKATDRQCPHCGQDNPALVKTCRSCGEGLIPHCLRCGAHMPVWEAQCPNCGTDQAAYREQLAAQERERERQRAERAARSRRYYPPVTRRWPRRGFWRIGWMFWPLMWLLSNFGRRLRPALESLQTQGLDLSLLQQFPAELLPLAIGACIFGVGAVVFLASTTPRLFPPD